jgi:PAS domain S-box-containing protein
MHYPYYLELFSLSPSLNGHSTARIQDMLDFFRALFGTDFMPHLYCLRGEPAVLWLHVASDLAIAVCYFAIPFLLLRVVLKRKEVLFRRVALLFVLFITACGTTHLLGVWIVWVPMYRLEGVVKAATALFSIATVIVLLKLRAQIEQLPSFAELEKEVHERRQAEEEARDKEERFKSFVEGVQDYAMFMIDPQGHVQTWNKGAERAKGYSAEEIVGRHCSRFYTLEDRARKRPEEAIKTATEEGKYESEGWRVRKDGSRFWGSTVLRPLYDSAGELRGFATITRDLTQARAMEAKYQTLLDAAPDSILMYGNAGVVTYMNQRVEELFGYSRAELMGQPVDLLIPERLRTERAKHRMRFFNTPASQALGTGGEYLCLHRDGHEFAVEASVRPLETPEGMLALAAIRDVSDRKKAEMRFRNLLESAPDAMVIVNAEGWIELANLQTEKLFGYTRTELVGQSVDLLVPQNLREMHGAHGGRFFEFPRTREMGAGLDLLAIRKDGTEFPVEISLSPLEGPEGTSVTTAIRDVTERKRAAEQLAEKMTELRHSNEALEQFAHIASHDLQEPLRMVASYVQLLSRRYKGKLDGDAEEFIAYAVDGTQRMKRLIEDLLLYSRAGKHGPPVHEMPSEAALQEALNNLHRAIEENHALITYDALPRVRAADSQLVQLFQNLVGNAIKYRAERTPEIHVSAQAGEREWVFSIADNGIGIEERFYERIFEIFQRLHGRGEYEGTGIGLAICKRILQQQGGRIWVDSEVGRGSIFHFALPTK